MNVKIWPVKKSTALRPGRHCVFNMHIYLVFVTKYRRKVFNKKILRNLQQIFADVCHNFEADLIEFDGEDDHVHLLINYSPQVAISKLVNRLKGVSSRLIKRNHGGYINKFLWKNNF